MTLGEPVSGIDEGSMGEGLSGGLKAIVAAVSPWSLLFLILVCLLPNDTAAQNLAPLDKAVDHNILREMFDKLAIHRKASDRDGIILKWDHPVLVQILSERGAIQEFMATIDETLTEMQRLSKIDTRIVYNNSNFILMISDDVLNELEKQKALLGFFLRGQKAADTFLAQLKPEDASCIQILQSSAGNRIQAYLAVVSVDLKKISSDKIKNCFTRVIMTGFGFVESTVGIDSVYGEGEDRASLSPYDEQLIKVLYSDSFTTGETRSAVFEKIDRVLEETPK